MPTSAAKNETRDVSDQQLAMFTALIYDKTGVRIPPQKKTLLSNRLRRRMKVREIDCYDKYYQLLKRAGGSDPEWDQLFQEVTTHETYLFRDTAQWEWFQQGFIAEVLADVRHGRRPRRLRLWSAACSTGDEAYTMAACLAGNLADHPEWTIEIVGTDIGVGAVEEASNATFNDRRMQEVPETLKRRFFRQRRGETTWEPLPTLTKMTSFKKHNLMTPLAEAPFDIVFLKNVLIYFDDESKKQVLSNVIDRIKSGGYLVTGRAEGVGHLLQGVSREQTWLHRKP
ncbi:MAG: protein-glutamate O-methyltransferase CheR [Planctomycetales bacterium]|nr:protein-glutamate O-methyltransferase CheR [Planctomycetales bacterium]